MKWKTVIYVVRAKSGSITDNSKIRQTPLVGGPSRLILEAPQLWDIECPRMPGARCIYVQTVAGEGDTERLKVFSFRPETGERKELPAIEAKVDNPNLIFSHDGRFVAWQSGPPNSDRFGLRIASMDSDWMRFVALPHWFELYGVDWSADSKALWVCSRNSRGNSNLIKVGLDGSITTVLSGPNLSLEWAIPSPDGHRLAIVKDSNSSNVSLLEAF